jgi:hypothetical protein
MARRIQMAEMLGRKLRHTLRCVAGRTTWDVEIDKIQHNLDAFIAHYNLRRGHQGYRLAGPHTGAGGSRKRWASATCRRLPVASSCRRERRCRA